MSFGVGHRSGSDPQLLWLWCRPAATALIRPLAWETPYAKGAALKRQTKQNTLLNPHPTKNKQFIEQIYPTKQPSTRLSELIWCLTFSLQNLPLVHVVQ